MQNSPRCVVLTPRTRRPASSPPGKQNAFKESRRLRESMDGSMGSFTQTILHFSPPRGGGDPFRSPEGQGLNGHGGLSAAGSHKAASITYKEIGHVVSAVVRIDH